MSDNTAVLFERLGEHVARVTINRESAGNSVNGEVAAGMDAAVKATESDDDIWAVVLTGAGSRVFCAGADLKEISAGRADQLMTPDGGFGGFVFARRTKPWIAAIEGAALAGGMEIALACELRVASENARFGLPEVKRGLMAAAGGLFRLPRALPQALAFELIATGDALDARRAHAHGLVSRLTAAGGAMDEALALARTICGNAPLAVRESLAVARAALVESDEDLIQRGWDGWARLTKTEDFHEGPRAFVEKRAPRWQGK